MAEFFILFSNEEQQIKRLNAAAHKKLTSDDSIQVIEYNNEILKPTEKLETAQISDPPQHDKCAQYVVTTTACVGSSSASAKQAVVSNLLKASSVC